MHGYVQLRAASQGYLLTGNSYSQRRGGKSRMSREVHVRFREGLVVRSPWALIPYRLRAGGRCQTGDGSTPKTLYSLQADHTPDEDGADQVPETVLARRRTVRTVPSTFSDSLTSGPRHARGIG